jgi:hypothetical protein
LSAKKRSIHMINGHLMAACDSANDPRGDHRLSQAPMDDYVTHTIELAQAGAISHHVYTLVRS